MDEFKQRLWQRPVHGEMCVIMPLLSLLSRAVLSQTRAILHLCSCSRSHPLAFGNSCHTADAKRRRLSRQLLMRPGPEQASDRGEGAV
eukprot:1138441-Rhodomonas_salina.1